MIQELCAFSLTDHGRTDTIGVHLSGVLLLFSGNISQNTKFGGKLYIPSVDTLDP